MSRFRNFSEELVAAEQVWKAAEHLLEFKFPSIRDPKILLKAVSFLEKVVKQTMSLVLKLEHTRGNVGITREGTKNLELFYDIVAPVYGVAFEDVDNFKEVLDLGKRREEEELFFSNRGNAIISDGEGGEREVTYAHLIRLLSSVKRVQMAFKRRLRAVGKI